MGKFIYVKLVQGNPGLNSDFLYKEPIIGQFCSLEGRTASTRKACWVEWVVASASVFMHVPRSTWIIANQFAPL